jgi:hypothetical protein
MSHERTSSGEENYHLSFSPSTPSGSDEEEDEADQGEQFVSAHGQDFGCTGRCSECSCTVQRGSTFCKSCGKKQVHADDESRASSISSISAASTRYEDTRQSNSIIRESAITRDSLRWSVGADDDALNAAVARDRAALTNPLLYVADGGVNNSDLDSVLIPGKDGNALSLRHLHRHMNRDRNPQHCCTSRARWIAAVLVLVVVLTVAVLASGKGFGLFGPQAHKGEKASQFFCSASFECSLAHAASPNSTTPQYPSKNACLAACKDEPSPPPSPRTPTPAPPPPPSAAGCVRQFVKDCNLLSERPDGCPGCVQTHTEGELTAQRL